MGCRAFRLFHPCEFFCLFLSDMKRLPAPAGEMVWYVDCSILQSRPRRSDKMVSNTFKATGTILGLVLLLLLPSSLARAQESEVIAGGELEYQNACAVCHGVEA